MWEVVSRTHNSVKRVLNSVKQVLISGYRVPNSVKQVLNSVKQSKTQSNGRANLTNGYKPVWDPEYGVFYIP